MLKVPIVMYRAMGCAVLCRAVLKSNVSCRVEICRALLHCGSSRPWRRNPDRTDSDLKLELPECIAQASCNRNSQNSGPARAQDQIQFRSPRPRHPRNLAPRMEGPRCFSRCSRSRAFGSPVFSRFSRPGAQGPSIGTYVKHTDARPWMGPICRNIRNPCP